ncbi:unnamed protein product [Somion occarium]|uniref:Uncharacterized protein n=1 Tax=Somion occarium TaxID=3059160 RepID=A0ABP1D941_9APHY
MSSDSGPTPDEIIATLSEWRTVACIIIPALASQESCSVFGSGSSAGSLRSTFSLDTAQSLIWVFKSSYFFGCPLLFTGRLDSIQATFGVYCICSCVSTAIVAYVLDVICMFAVAAFNCLRVWAICPNRWFPITLVFALSMFTPIMNIYRYSRPQAFSLISSGPLASCVDESLGPTYLWCQFSSLITRAISVAADIAVLTFTLLETRAIFKTSLQLHTDTNVTTILFRNGSLQFFVLLILNAITMTLDILSIAATAGDTVTTFIFINEGLASVLLSRFLLDLRSVYLADGDGSDPTVSSVRFAASVIGNMGAPLNASWAASSVSEPSTEIDERVEYSSNPLAVGLFDFDQGSGLILTRRVHMP